MLLLAWSCDSAVAITSVPAAPLVLLSVASHHHFSWSELINLSNPNGRQQTRFLAGDGGGGEA